MSVRRANRETGTRRGAGPHQSPHDTHILREIVHPNSRRTRRHFSRQRFARHGFYLYNIIVFCDCAPTRFLQENGRRRVSFRRGRTAVIARGSDRRNWQISFEKSKLYGYINRPINNNSWQYTPSLRVRSGRVSRVLYHNMFLTCLRVINFAEFRSLRIIIMLIITTC